MVSYAPAIQPGPSMELTLVHNTRRLALLIALGLTILVVLFPPFSVGSMGMSQVEYGFLFTGPASARNARAAMQSLLGSQAAAAQGDLFSVSISAGRLLVELLIVWALYAAVRMTVLRRVKAA